MTDLRTDREFLVYLQEQLECLDINHQSPNLWSLVDSQLKLILTEIKTRLEETES